MEYPLPNSHSCRFLLISPISSQFWTLPFQSQKCCLLNQVRVLLGTFQWSFSKKCCLDLTKIVCQRKLPEHEYAQAVFDQALRVIRPLRLQSWLLLPYLHWNSWQSSRNTNFHLYRLFWPWWSQSHQILSTLRCISYYWRSLFSSLERIFQAFQFPSHTLWLFFLLQRRYLCLFWYKMQEFRLLLTWFSQPMFLEVSIQLPNLHSNIDFTIFCWFRNMKSSLFWLAFSVTKYRFPNHYFQ